MEAKDIKEMSYNEAVAELEAIVRKMESDQCDIDTLSSYTERALKLLKFCKERLMKTDKNLESALEELKNALGE